MLLSFADSHGNFSTLNKFTMLTIENIPELKQSLRGKLIQPQDSDYDEARKVYNGMINKYPALIAKCVNVADVMTTVNFARENNILISIWCGGHNGGGLGICDKGLVIDLSPMKGLHVDPFAKTVWVEGGCTLGDVDHATHAFGMSTSSGIFSTTGVDPDPSNNDIISTWAKDYWEALHPYSAGGAYLNFMMDEGEERVKATY